LVLSEGIGSQSVEHLSSSRTETRCCPKPAGTGAAPPAFIALTKRSMSQLNGTVAEIAYYWGFTNLGRFARAYRECFGNCPAATLAAARCGSAGHRH
jgi:AraC-like DNA-binding protein